MYVCMQTPLTYLNPTSPRIPIRPHCHFLLSFLQYSTFLSLPRTQLAPIDPVHEHDQTMHVGMLLPIANAGAHISSFSCFPASANHRSFWLCLACAVRRSPTELHAAGISVSLTNSWIHLPGEYLSTGSPYLH